MWTEFASGDSGNLTWASAISLSIGSESVLVFVVFVFGGCARVVVSLS